MNVTMTKPVGRYRVVLGSSSPRRQDLLHELGLTFTVIKPDFDEVQQPDEGPEDYALRNAISKCRNVRDQVKAEGALSRQDTLIIGADTIVLLSGQVLEKPADEAHAEAMLRSLSGKSHLVVTALALLADGPSGLKEYKEAVVTEVTFRDLSSAEIAAYIATREPFDKAGGYAIQGRAAYMVARISGSHSNVIGLPLSELVSALKGPFGWDLWGEPPCPNP